MFHIMEKRSQQFTTIYKGGTILFLCDELSLRAVGVTHEVLANRERLFWLKHRVDYRNATISHIFAGQKEL